MNEIFISIGSTLGGLAFIGGSIFLYKKLQKDIETKNLLPISSNSETSLQYDPKNPFNQNISAIDDDGPGVWVGGRKTKKYSKRV